jgi:hypothetical protein
MSKWAWSAVELRNLFSSFNWVVAASDATEWFDTSDLGKSFCMCGRCQASTLTGF